jgi:hypothetical protein
MRKRSLMGLVIREGALEERLALAVGDSFPIAGTHATLSEVAPWTGLLQSPNGMPMAHLYLKGVGGGANVFLPDGQWVTLDEGSKGLLVWHASEEEARTASQRERLGLDHARWGVVEGESVSWFSVFTPGTGIDLDDGRQLVLQEVIENGAALRVGITTPEGWKERIVPANNADADPLVRFENCAALPRTVVLDAWKADAALATCFQHGARTAQAELATGERWSAPGLPTTIWLAGLQSSAVPGYPREDGPLGAVLEAPNRRYVVGTLQQERIGDATVAFLGEKEVIWHYTLEIAKPGAQTPIQVQVSTDGDSAQVDDWQIAALPPSSENPQGAQLLVTPRPFGLRW